jgi:hypothetical protein
MGMMIEFERIEDGRLLKVYITNFGNFLTNMDTMLGNVKAFITKYPADATELNGYLASAKTQIQAILNKY